MTNLHASPQQYFQNKHTLQSKRCTNTINGRTRMGVLLFYIPVVPLILHAPEGSCASTGSHLPWLKKVNQFWAHYLSSSFAVLLATGFMRNLLRKDRRKRPNMPVGPIQVDAQYAWIWVDRWGQQKVQAVPYKHSTLWLQEVWRGRPPWLVHRKPTCLRHQQWASGPDCLSRLPPHTAGKENVLWCDGLLSPTL